MISLRIVLVLVSALVLAALWLAFSPQPSVSAPAQPRTFDLLIKDGKPASVPDSMRVRQGDEVTLSIESDRNDELHVHGYDLKLRIKAGEPAVLEFAATRSGRFELELHRRHTAVGALEVYPK